jgi:hypothetical protein
MPTNTSTETGLDLQRLLMLLLFAGSGCSALIYEIVWYQVLQLAIGGNAAQETAGLFHDLAAQHRASRGQSWTALNHGRCSVKHDGRLISAACSTHYLGELLAIGEQVIQAKHGRQCALALFACQSDWHGSVLSQPVWSQRAVEGSHDVTPLPIGQDERLACVLAFDMP